MIHNSGFCIFSAFPAYLISLWITKKTYMQVTMQTTTIWKSGVYPCKSVTLFSINLQQFNTTFKLFRYFLHSGGTRIQRMTCKCQWSYNGNFSKVIGNLKSGIYLRWYLNFLLVYFSMKNLIKSSNNKLNLTTLFIQSNK